MLRAKWWWESKTVWFCLVLMIIAGAGYLLEWLTGGDLPLRPDERLVTLILSAVHLVLRFATKEPLRLR